MASLPPRLQKDQADGLRQRLSAPLPGLCTVLSADDHVHSPENKPALMRRLAQSMARRGQKVLVLDARSPASAALPGLMDVAQGRMSLAQLLDAAAETAASGVTHIAFGAAQDRVHQDALTALLRQLTALKFHVLVDAELDAAGQLPLTLLSDGELVLQVSTDAASICRAYDMMRALKSLCLMRALSLLVTGASAAHARQAQANLFHAASRYLAMPVRAIVPPSTVHHV